MLRKCALLLVSFSFLYNCYSQQEEYKPHNELNICINYTTVKNNNTENRLGYGVGYYRKWKLHDKLSLLTGIEYNRLVQFKYLLIRNQESYYSNTTYRFSNINFPLLIRKYYGSFFIEPGLFFEINIGGNRNGNYYGTLAGNDATNEPDLYPFYLNIEHSGSNYGPLLGLGFEFSVKNHKFLLKTDYKYGLEKFMLHSDHFHTRYIRYVAGFNF